MVHGAGLQDRPGSQKDNAEKRPGEAIRNEVFFRFFLAARGQNSGALRCGHPRRSPRVPAQYALVSAVIASWWECSADHSQVGEPISRVSILAYYKAAVKSRLFCLFFPDSYQKRRTVTRKVGLVGLIATVPCAGMHTCSACPPEFTLLMPGYEERRFNTRSARSVFHRLGWPGVSMSKCTWPACLACSGQVPSLRRF